MTRRPVPPDDSPAPAITEGLLSSGAVRLFGRPYAGLLIGDLGLLPAANHPLATAIRSAEAAGRKPSLARIYSVGQSTGFETLTEPMIVMVFSAGEPPPPSYGGQQPDVLMWVFDRLDMVLRINVQIGWMQDVVLDEIGDAAPRRDLVGRDGNLIGRDGNLIGRDGNLIGKGR